MPSTVRWIAVLVALSLAAAACGSDGEATADSGAATGSTNTTAPAESEPVVDQAEEVSEADSEAVETPADESAAIVEEAPVADAEEEAQPVPAEEPADGAAEPDFPVTIESAAGSFTIESQPQRIVSLSPTATEMLFAVGAGDQVIAVDSFSYFPPEAPVTELSGFDPNVEAVLSYDPDLVVVAFDANDLVASLSAVGVPVLFSNAPATLDEGYGVLAELGIAVGRVDETAELTRSLRDEIELALASSPQLPIRLYHELDDTYYSASSFGFVGDVYQHMGVTNIADEADSDGYGFPQLTEEYIVDSDPELIVITDLVGYTPDDVAARPGWDEISAVKSGSIVVVNADIASRWGPRLPEFINTVADALATVGAPTG